MSGGIVVNSSSICKFYFGDFPVSSTVAKKKKSPSAFGRRLKELRVARGLTQVDLSQLTGWPQVMISRMEVSPAWNPTAETVLRLSAALNCTPNDLLMPGSGTDGKSADS